MNLLALDLAGVTGWALDADDIDVTENPEYGSIKFEGALGARALAFEIWLVKFIIARNVTSLAIEAATPQRSGATNLDSLMWLHAAIVIARKVCAKLNIKLILVNVSTWRSFFINAQPPKGLTKHQRRKWLKTMTIAQCHEMGHDPQDDNAADALGILTYCLACFDPKNGMDPNELYAEAA